MKDFLNNPKLDHLTTREKEVLAYIIDGLHNVEIAQKLGISFHTAKAHVSSILHKLGINSRTSAIKIAVADIINNNKDLNNKNKNFQD